MDGSKFGPKDCMRQLVLAVSLLVILFVLLWAKDAAEQVGVNALLLLLLVAVGFAVTCKAVACLIRAVTSRAIRF